MVPLIAVLWFQYQNTATSGTKPLILSATFSLQVPKNASKIKANLEFHQSSDDFIASASPRANCPFLPFCPNKRRSWWEWTIWWSFALALFLVWFLWGGVDDGKGEWDVNWYIWRKLYTNEGLKVSATIATIATIAKRMFLAEKIRSADVLTNKWFLWLLINRPCSVLFTVLNGGFIYGQI